MSKRRASITAGEIAIERATLGCMSHVEWPNDCPQCQARMQFDTTVEARPRRVCPACGTTVDFVDGEKRVTRAADQAAIAAHLRTTEDNVRVLLAI